MEQFLGTGVGVFLDILAVGNRLGPIPGYIDSRQ